MRQNICSDRGLNSESHSEFSFYNLPVWIIIGQKGMKIWLLHDLDLSCSTSAAMLH